MIQKNRKLKSYTAEDIEKIVKMNDKGFKAKEIASIIGISDRSAATYIAIVDNLSNGLPISSDKHTYCERAVKEFCENHGIEYRHVSDEQKPDRAPETPTEAEPARDPNGASEQLPGQMSVDDVMEFQPLPPAAGKQKEPDALRQARDEMSRAIARFIEQVMRYYMATIED